MSQIPIALQLYSVREDCAEDLPALLAAVVRMGYAGVEFYGYHEPNFLGHTAAELRAMLDDTGLKVCGTHMRLTALEGDELKRSIEFHHDIGNPYLIVSSLPRETILSREAMLKITESFNHVAEQLAPEGMRTGYHNHHIEFQPVDGELPWDTFFQNTREEVIMQIDTGNALHGAAEPLPFLEKYPGRAQTVHLKEHSATNDTALLGEGDVNWQDIFDFCEGPGDTEWYIVEQEKYAHPPLECAERCLKNLRGMGKH